MQAYSKKDGFTYISSPERIKNDLDNFEVEYELVYEEQNPPLQNKESFQIIDEKMEIETKPDSLQTIIKKKIEAHALQTKRKTSFR